MENVNSLNSEFSELDLQKLEDRLETDPLAISGLLNVNYDVETTSDFCFDYVSTEGETSCGLYW
ncbi:hypothetical protein [Parabacteroides sp.]